MFFLCTTQYAHHVGVFGARCSGGLGCRTARSQMLRVTEAEQTSGGQEPVHQSETKVCFVITGRGWNSSELTPPPRRLCNTRLPLQQSHHLDFSRSSCSLSSAQTCLTYYSPPCLLWLSTFHPIGMPCISGACDFAGITFCSLSTSVLFSLKLCAERSRGAELSCFMIYCYCLFYTIVTHFYESNNLTDAFKVI